MIEVRSFTEVGGHAENEDAFAALTHPGDNSLWIAMLADGQGGQFGGGAAARLACKRAMEFAIESTNSHSSHWTDPRTWLTATWLGKKEVDYTAIGLANPRTWSEILRCADAAVADEAMAGFTTFVGLCVTGSQVVGTSSGDSAVLLLRAGEAVDLTARQRKNPPVGSRGAISVPFSERLVAPWKIVLMSDGVWKYAGWDRVCDLAREQNGDELIAVLQTTVRHPRTGRFPDDFTIVLIESIDD